MFALTRLSMAFATIGRAVKYNIQRGYVIPRPPSRLIGPYAKFYKERFDKVGEGKVT